MFGRNQLLRLAGALLLAGILAAMGTPLWAEGGSAAGEALEDGQQSPPRHGASRVGLSPTTSWVRVTGCLDNKAGPLSDPGTDCEGITIEAADGAIWMVHEGAMLNCCADISVAVERPGRTEIRFVEQESGDFCYCICPYDLEAGVEGLAAGYYRVEVRDPQDSLLCERWVQLGSGGLGVVSSGCLDGYGKEIAEHESVEFTVVGNSIVIAHRGAYLNCCLELKVDVDASPGLYRVTEIDHGEPCDCLCFFDFIIVIPEAPAGEHLVELVGVDGELVATAIVTVP